MKTKTDAEDGQAAAVALMTRSQGGDRVAFDELMAITKEGGISIIDGWSDNMLLNRLQDRASPKNLLSRAAVEEDLKAAVSDLADRADGPIERMIVKRAALCAVEVGLDDLDHFWSVRHVTDPATSEAIDRRRDRAHRRLLSTLKALAAVRRMNRPAVQVNVGDGNVNVLRA